MILRRILKCESMNFVVSFRELCIALVSLEICYCVLSLANFTSYLLNLNSALDFELF